MYEAAGAMKKVPRSRGMPLRSSSSIPVDEDARRKRGSDGETSARAAAVQKKAREDQTGRVGEERVTRSSANSARRVVQERNVEECGKGADDGTRERSFSWERQAMKQQEEKEEEEERQERQETQEEPEIDAEAAVAKLTQTKEYFAELCRNYLANYKTQGADVSFRLAHSTSPCTKDSPNAACPEKESTFDERSAAGRTPSFSAAGGAARPPPASTNYQSSRSRMPSDAEIAKHAHLSSSHNHQPPPECRRMPSNFDAFLRTGVLLLDNDPSNASYQEELSALESRALLILESLHRKEQQVEGDWGGGHGECDGTILCKEGVSAYDTLKVSQFQSYQFAFKAAAVAEIVRLKSSVVKSRNEVVELPRNDALGKSFVGVRTEGELVKQLKLEREFAAKELARLRAEKTAKEESFAEIQTVKRRLESRISSCTCRNITPWKRTGEMMRNVTAPCELKSPAFDGVPRQQQSQQDHREMGSRVKAMGAWPAEDESRVEGICETSVEQEVVRLVTEKLEAVKADMGFFVKTLQSRIADIAGKITSDESRVRPVRVGLFCLQILIDKLLAKKAEIEASLVEQSPDNRLRLKLHFRS